MQESALPGHELPERARALRTRWRTASLASGWPFPNDWRSVTVDATCVAVVTGADVDGRISELGGQRARAGVGLDTSIQDVAALHAATGEHTGLVAANVEAVPVWMVRAVALGWSEVITEQAIAQEAEDALTGLTTSTYLRTRLREVYRAAISSGRSPGEDYALITVAVEDSGPDHGSGEAASWNRLMAMVVAADVLREVFRSGETLSLLRHGTAAVLSSRDERLPTRCDRAHRLLARRLCADSSVSSGFAIRMREQALPVDHSQACELLAQLV